MLENTRARGCRAERPVRSDCAIQIDFYEFTRLNLAHKIRADHIKRDRFAGKYRSVTEEAHHQWPYAERIAAGDHSLIGHANQRIRTLNQPQCINEPVKKRWITARRDQMNDHLGVRGRLKYCALAHQFVLQRHRVRDVAIVRDGKTARCQICKQGLNIAQARPACC